MLHTLRRVARHSPVYAGLVVAAVGVTTGLTVVVLSAVAAVRRPVSPLRDPDRVAVIASSGDGRTRDVTAWQRFERLDPRTVPLERVSYARSQFPIVLAKGNAANRRVIHLEPGILSLLHAAPLAGRYAAAGDTIPGMAVAMISERMWRRDFGSGALGEASLQLDGVAHTVIGVVPPGGGNIFDGDVLVPTSRAELSRSDAIVAVGSLREGATWPELQQSLRTAAQALSAEWGAGTRPFRFTPLDTREGQLPLSEFLRALLVGAAVLVVIAILNLATLTLARVAGRSQAYAVQLAIGASRRRLLFNTSVEAVVLAACGGLVGLSLSGLGMGTLRRWLPADVPHLGHLRLQFDGWVVLSAMIVAMLTAVGFSFLPALRASASDPEHALRGARSTGRVRSRVIPVLLAAQMSLAVALLCSTTLLWRAADRAAVADHGFDPRGLAQFTVRTGTQTATAELQAAEAALKGTGVSSVAWSAWLAYSGLSIEGSGSDGERRALYNPAARVISPSWLATMRIRVLAGRDFQPGDELGPPLAIVDARTARELWPADNPVGQQVSVVHKGTRTWARVICVAAPAKSGSLFDPWIQPVATTYFSSGGDHRQREFVVRVSDADPARSLGQLNARLRDALPGRPFVWMREPAEEIEAMHRTYRFVALVALLFAVVALAFCALGLFAALNHAIEMRRTELAVRVALGARPGSLFRDVVRQGGTVVLGGLAAGGILAIWSSRVVDPFLFDLYRIDVLALVLAEILLVGVMSIAVLPPALRAGRTTSRDVSRNE